MSKEKKSIVHGKFTFTKKKKKNKKSDYEINLKKMKKEKKRFEKQSICNHLDRKDDEPKFKKITVTEGDSELKYNKCKICGALLLRDPLLLSDASIETSANVVYTTLSAIHSKYNLDSNIEKNIINAKRVMLQLPTLASKLNNNDKKNKHKKDKNKKKKKKNNKTFARIDY